MKEMLKRVFSRKPEVKGITKSHRYTPLMWGALEQLAEKAGESPNAFVVMVLDQYLQSKMEDGTLDMDLLNRTIETERTA